MLYIEDMEIITRKEAIKRGLPRYFTGKPCKNGHISERVTKKCDCVECNNERNAAYRSIPENREIARVRASKWREDFGIKNVYEMNEEWKIKTFGSTAEYWRQYQKKRDKEKLREYSLNRVARIRNAEGTHTTDDIALILEEQNFTCPYCLASLADGYHVDHYIPLSLGGSNWPDNLQCLCPTCNTRKGAKLPYDWHKELWPL